ncbi:MAG: phosphotransferase [Hamadaea sp.]|nr:phosphotransferase [Hamadaea sp.]
MATEVPLTGGRLTSGVVRVADTVRRPAPPAGQFTAALLDHLHARGFTGTPRHLGRDDQGREILSFLPGDVPAKWRRHTDGQVTAAARLLRGFHDASRDLAAPAGFAREFFSGYEEDDAVICHHDPGPNNTVFRAGVPVAFIDVDFAAPGRRIEDVAYLAWSWCISSRPDRGSPAEQARQVRELAAAYGLTAAEHAALPDAIRDRMRRNVEFWRARPGDRSAEIVAWTLGERAFLDAHATAFRPDQGYCANLGARSAPQP